QGTGVIMLASENGGTREQLVTVKEGELAHGAQMLPDGQHVLFTLGGGPSVASANDRWEKARIVVQSLATQEQKTVIEGGTDARFAPTGHLVYALSGSLYAIPFDVKRLTTTGGAVPMVEGVRRAPGGTTGAAHAAISTTGSLVYFPGPASTSAGQFELVLADR